MTKNISMKKINIYIVLFLLMIFSLITNYYARFILTSYENYFIKQFIWFIFSFIGLFIISKININYFLKKGFYFYILGLFLLILTLIFGVTVNGSKSWISFGFFSFQASEFMKVFLIIFLRYFSLKYRLSDIKYIIYTFIIVLIPSVLVFLEPDTGAVLIYLIIYIVFLFLRRLNKWWYISGFIICLLLLGTFFSIYFMNRNLFIELFGTSFFYRMDRIVNFASKEGYQIKKALTSIGTSGFFGLKKSVYFPEAPTDFAFTLLISKLGLVGILLFLALYFFLFLNLCQNKYDLYLKYTLIYLLLFQFTVNIFMNIGLIPIIGIPLPFISYGGSSLLSYMLLIGFVINTKNY